MCRLSFSYNLRVYVCIYVYSTFCTKFVQEYTIETQKENKEEIITKTPISETSGKKLVGYPIQGNKIFNSTKDNGEAP